VHEPSKQGVSSRSSTRISNSPSVTVIRDMASENPLVTDEIEIPRGLRLIVGAQACGFGPASKLLAIASSLNARHELAFWGEGSALSLAKCNSDLFTSICEYPSDFHISLITTNFDAGIVVMDHRLAFQVFLSGHPMYFFDSLFTFWVTAHSPAELVLASERIRTLDKSAASEFFYSFGAHDQKLLCHLLATRGCIQAFFGATKRVEEYERAGARNLELIGHMVTIPKEYTTQTMSPGTLLVNLGGVSNFVLSFGKNDYYVTLIERLVRDIVRTRRNFSRAIICCGKYSTEIIENIGDARIERRLLSHDEFIGEVASAEFYMTSPGLTSIIESACLNKPFILLPDQHYSQYHNTQQLSSNDLDWLAVTWSHVFGNYIVPNSDVAGSLAIIDCARIALSDSAIYTRLLGLLLNRIDRQFDHSGEKGKLICQKIREENRYRSLNHVLTDIESELHSDT